MQSMRLKAPSSNPRVKHTCGTAVGGPVKEDLITQGLRAFYTFA